MKIALFCQEVRQQYHQQWNDPQEFALTVSECRRVEMAAADPDHDRSSDPSYLDR